MDEIKDDIEVLGVVDQQYGFDNNVNLDSDRERDGYVETMAMIDLTYDTTTIKGLELKAGVDVFNSLYFINNINNVLSTSPYMGFNITLAPTLVWKNRVVYNHFYTNFSPNNFSQFTFATDLRYYMRDNLYFEAGYSFMPRWYPHQKIRVLTAVPVGQLASNSVIGDDDRRDNRYSIRYNAGWDLEDMSIMIDNEFIGNNSNYVYQQSYDYWAIRTTPSILYFFNDKFYTDLSFTYEYTDYKDRRGVDASNRNRIVREYRWDINAALYYDITANTTCDFTYSYNENNSNDPTMKYSNSQMTVGASYSF
ncbi:hypothetical protein ACFL4E_02980 [Candidatus Omnitrophota bacterium]